MPFDETPETEQNAPQDQAPAGRADTVLVDEFELGPVESKVRGKRATEKASQTHDEPLSVERENVNQNINFGSQSTPEKMMGEDEHGRPASEMPGPEDGPAIDQGANFHISAADGPAGSDFGAIGQTTQSAATSLFDPHVTSQDGQEIIGATPDLLGVPSGPLDAVSDMFGLGALSYMGAEEGGGGATPVEGASEADAAEPSGRATATEPVTTPTNLAPTDLTLASASVDENAANGTAIGTVATSDPDNPTETFQYSLVDDAGGRFAIDTNTGALTVADGSLLDHETAGGHNITVRVTDSASNTYTETLTIAVDDVNETPTDLDLSSASISEGSSNGDPVGTITASDPDSGDTFTYSLSSDAGGRFAIDANTGVISVADSSLLDYETATSHTVTVQVTDSGAETYTETFTINLTDDTSEAQVSALADSNAAADHVMESVANGTSVGITALASDADATDDVSYALTDDAGGRFAIDANTGVITVADNSLLDYETATSHSVTVTATSDDGSTSTQSFTVNLGDDTSEAQVGAISDSNAAANQVSESAANGTAVGVTALASDADATDDVSYALTDDAGGRFAIDANTGVISVADSSSLDYETATSHTVTVTATSDDGSTSTQSFTVNLADDTSEAQVGAISDSNAAANQVSESAANGTAVGVTALASDADATDDVSYALTDDAGGRFAIDANTGVITVADSSSLDYETATSHTVTVTATSDDGSTSTQSFTVNLSDDTSEGQVGAISDSNAAANQVSESAANGTAVGVTALASDADATDDVSYALTDDAGGRFAIDANTGVITVADSSSLDYETATSHSVTVTATSDDGSTSTQSFTVNLSDDTSEAQVGAISDNNVAANQVSEIAGNGTAVGITALASDADATDDVSYALTDDAGGRFAIDANTGVITVADTSLIDYETATSHTVTVTATSDDGSTSTQAFTVNIADANEAGVGAISDTDGSANSVSESAANGTAVGVTAFAQDPDIADDVSYALTDDAGGRFAIDANTGVISVADSSSLDYETATSHTVTVTATSDDGSTNTQSFTVNLSDDTSEAQVGAISDSNVAANQVSESAANGTAVGITALASDADATDDVSYALTDDAGGRFAIDANTGVISVADSSSLDYETATSHTVTVTATSDDGSTSTQSFTVNLSDDTSEAQVGAISDSNAAANQVSESAANGTAVGVTALASDADATDDVSYALTDDAGGRFAIDANTGVISVADSSSLDYETATSHTVTVTATSDDGSTSTQSFTVNLADDTSEAQVGAISDSNVAANQVSESAANGTAVGVTALATDADGTDDVSYALTDDAGGRFAIDANTGVISVADSSSLDYETATSHTVTVTATSDDGSTSTQSFTVNLSDDTSEAQVGAISDSNAAANQVSESAANGTAVGVTALASDADATDDVSYALTDDAGGRFAIDANTGVISVADSSSLDYETATSHTVTVTATSDDGSTSTQSFTVNLSDDTSEAQVGAISDSNVAANQVSESAANGTAVGVTALATDADGTDDVSYALTDDAGGRFAIDANTGVISVADSSSLDYETATSHSVTVTATSDDGSTSTQSFTVNLSDDTSEAQVGAISDSNASANSVSESAANGTAVGVTALASDADATDDVSYALTDDAGGRFAIDANTGVISVADSSSLDYETATSHNVTVTATSDDGSTSTQTFTVNLSDDTSEAQVGAISDSNAAANQVSESAANGTAVGVTALATDADATDDVSYALTDDAGGRFAIDANTGVISVADSASLDYETATSHNVTVTATSDDGSTSTQTFTVNLSDDTSEAQVGAISDSNAAANQVSESAANGTAVGVTALASDADATDDVSYALTDDAGGRFAIDANTGVISVADSSSLDYETATSHNVTVTATSDDGSTSTQTFTVNLSDDTSEAQVGAISDSNVAANQVSESAANGTAVGVTALATDADGTDDVSYALTDDAGGRFAIDANTGVISVADSSSLDYETATSHNVTVTATSDDGSTSTQTFTVNLSDDTSEAQVGAISDSNASANQVSESAANGTAVGVTALATDADTSDDVSYSLTDDAGGRFQIDASTGVIAVANSSLLNYETATSHNVTVTATSDDGSTSTQTFTVNLSDDTSEAQVGAVTDSDASANTVMENAANGTAVGVTASASDADATDDVSFSLSNDAGGRFAVDATTGQITVADTSLIDYETNTSHTVTVTATSDDGSTSTQSFTVNIGDSNEAPTDLTLSGSGDTFANAVNHHSPVAYWRLDDNASGLNTTAVDETGNHDGLGFGTDFSSSGPFSGISTKGTNFDGVQDNISVTHSDNFDIANGTVQMWFKVDDASASNEALMSMNDDGGSGDQYDQGNFSLYVHDGELAWYIEEDGSRNQINGGSVASDQWHHVTLTFGSDGMKMYLDGQLIGSDSYTGGIGNAKQNPLVIGASTYSSTAGTIDDLQHHFHGDIAEVSLHDTVMTQEQINDLIDAGSDGFALNGSTVLEGTYDGAIVGTLTASDIDDSASTLYYTLTDDAGGRFAIDNNGQITVANGDMIDYENTTSHSITAQVTDSDGNTYSESFTINVSDASDGAMVGGSGGDNWYGGSGNDNMFGAGGDDQIYGGSDDDAIYGGDDQDQVYGGTGNDVVFGGADTDQLYGEDGADTLSGGAAGDQMYGGSGTDTVTYMDSSAGVTVNLSNTTGHSGGDAAGDELYSIENLTGSSHADNLTGDSGGNVLSGLGGNDNIYGGSGGDTLDGGAGVDSLYGGSGSDLFMAMEGSGDSIYGGTGGGWTDTVHVDGAGGETPGTYGTDWTVNLTTGTIDATGGNYLDLSDDAAGTITLQDGSQVSFEGVERIEW